MKVRPVCLYATCLIVAAVTGTFVAADEVVTLSGEIEIADYSDDDSVASIMVYDSEWGSVLIAGTGKGAELRKHVGALVELTGTIDELDDDSGFDYAIHVTDYAIEQAADPDDAGTDTEDDPEDDGDD